MDQGDREQQQDRLALFHSADESQHLLVLADGMGGHENGAWAAQTVVDTARSRFEESMPIDNPAQFLRDICFEAHETIKTYSGNGGASPGSTCVILYLTPTEAHWIHVGDSRLYHFQSGRHISTTHDHSVAQLMKDYGEPLSAPQNQLYMCLGGDNEITPEYNFAPLMGHDLFLLCSDGLWGQLDDNAVSAEVERITSDTKYLEQMVRRARKQKPGQSDNIAVLSAYQAYLPRAGLRQWFKKWFNKQ